MSETVSCCQANSSYSKIYNPEEFETTGNIGQKKGTVKPKASTCNDDNCRNVDFSKSGKIPPKLSEFRSPENNHQKVI